MTFEECGHSTKGQPWGNNPPLDIDSTSNSDGQYVVDIYNMSDHEKTVSLRLGAGQFLTHFGIPLPKTTSPVILHWIPLVYLLPQQVAQKHGPPCSSSTRNNSERVMRIRHYWLQQVIATLTSQVGSVSVSFVVYGNAPSLQLNLLPRLSMLHEHHQ